MKIYSILENQKKFKENYKNFLLSSNGLGKIISKAKTSLIFLGFLFSIGLMVFLYVLIATDAVIGIFVYPLIAVLFVVFFIPMLLLVRKNIRYRSISRNSLNFLKGKDKLKVAYAVMIYNDSKYFSMLTYENNTTIETISKEQKILTELIKGNYNMNYMKIKKLMDHSEHKFIGRLTVTNYSDKKIHTYKIENITYYQVSIKAKLFKTHVITGIVDGSYFYPFPPTTWPSERVK